MKNSVKARVCASLLAVSVILSGCSVYNNNNSSEDNADTSLPYSSNSIASSSNDSSETGSFDSVSSDSSSSDNNVYVSNDNTSSTNPEVYKKTDVADNQIIYIYGDFENAEEIFDAAKAIRKEYGYNVIIVSDTLGDDIGQDYADDLYDTLLAKENISNIDGFAFVIDFANRKWIISTCGKAIDEFENSSIYSYINDKFKGHEACELPMILLNEIKKAI